MNNFEPTFEINIFSSNSNHCKLYWKLRYKVNLVIYNIKVSYKSFIKNLDLQILNKMKIVKSKICKGVHYPKILFETQQILGN